MNHPAMAELLLIITTRLRANFLQLSLKSRLFLTQVNEPEATLQREQASLTAQGAIPSSHSQARDEEA